MKKLEKLIKEMRKQLFPYHHEHDIERDEQRWMIKSGDYLESWIAEQLRICKKKNRCAKRGKCVFYDYGDLAKRNYEICHQVLLRLENGDIVCSIEAAEDEE
ncbi:MAG: hypothetical protein JXB45_03955 [Candidatus Krumholzibacteriota bacterium]|nr:hypothetical protein [Candidatus Krumholzibacteriota bacterium]